MGPGRHRACLTRQEAGSCCPTPPPPSPPHLDIWEKRERDTLRSTARQQLGSPARAGARIALAICEVEASLRSPLHLEQLCHLSLWPKLSARLRRSGGPTVSVGSLVRVVAQEHMPGLAEVLVLVRRGGWMVPVAMRLDGAQGPLGAGRAPILTTGRVWRGPGSKAYARTSFLADVGRELSTDLARRVVAAAGVAIVRP
jgi:hypothetical protein